MKAFYEFSGESRALLVCIRLVGRSVWFSVDPQPDDFWRVTVKKENDSFLRDLLREAGWNI